MCLCCATSRYRVKSAIVCECTLYVAGVLICAMGIGNLVFTSRSEDTDRTPRSASSSAWCNNNSETLRGRVNISAGIRRWCRWWEPGSSPGAGGHTLPLRVVVCVFVAGTAQRPESVSGRRGPCPSLSSLPGTLNVRIKFRHSTGIARSGGGVRASTTSYA